MKPVMETNLKEFKLVKKGKVRDIYEYDENHLLMIATDRISAFDFVLPNGIPDKGKILTKISIFWFNFFSDVDNHLVEWDVDKIKGLEPYRELLRDRIMLVKKAEVIKAECIVRGYLSGSGWKIYQKTGKLFEYELPPGLLESSKLEKPLFTPTTKAEEGHDLPLTLEEFRKVAGPYADFIIEKSVEIYGRAASYAIERGIIIADTKFEFGVIDGKVVLIDELLTPDSSRFWDLSSYAPGGSQPSFDKQFVRDYLLSTDWDRKSPPPPLPEDIVMKTREKYIDALRRLTGEDL